jgi:AAA family ATP:ADP antiporter
VIPIVYRFFALHLLIFFVLLRVDAPRPILSRVFFVWASVFNLFVVSVFWSFMTDLWRSEQSKRLFGFIAAGGSAGALTGPLITATLVERVGPAPLLLASVVLLEGAVQCAGRLARLAPQRDGRAEEPARAAEDRVGGGALDGIGLVLRSPYLLGIGAQTLLTTATATVLYLQQAQIVSAAFSTRAQRIAFFATIDLAVNVLTIAAQALVTGRVLRVLGVAVGLAAVPVVTAAGFLGLAASPTLWILTGFQGVRRATHHAFERPAREVLFTSVTREERYKAKSFLDAIVYRGGDAASAWAFAAVAPGAWAVAIAMIPAAGAWIALSAWLARRQEARARAADREAADREAAALAP